MPADNKHTVWWPRIITEVKNFVENCPTCVHNFTPHHEPFTPLSDYPWQTLLQTSFTGKETIIQ